LANRIALLKQEEMRTWKKIEETKKRADDIHKVRARNEEKVHKVRIHSVDCTYFNIENPRLERDLRKPESFSAAKLHPALAAS
jgi:hypothetical protein